MLFRRRTFVVAAAVACITACVSTWASCPLKAADAEAGSVDAATGYRMTNYRSPVTRPVEGGQQISLAELDALLKRGALLIDVMPARAGYDAKTGRWRLIERRDDIPSSTWLPNTGQGRLDPRLEAYFVSTLRHLTAGNLDRPLVFYCMADCWMSWNAVKRAAAFGYRNVKWYAEGTDGWAEAGRPLVAAEPPPVPALASTH